MLVVFNLQTILYLHSLFLQLAVWYLATHLVPIRSTTSGQASSLMTCSASVLVSEAARQNFAITSTMKWAVNGLVTSLTIDRSQLTFLRISPLTIVKTSTRTVMAMM